MIDIDKALTDPSSVFATPDEVCEAADLSGEQKIAVLRRWEHDARELQVAEEENMAGGSPPWSLDDVLAALRRLGADGGSGRPPSGQGGE